MTDTIKRVQGRRRRRDGPAPRPLRRRDAAGDAGGPPPRGGRGGPLRRHRRRRAPRAARRRGADGRHLPVEREDHLPGGPRPGRGVARGRRGGGEPADRAGARRPPARPGAPLRPRAASRFPRSSGPEGHSDGDVVLHALADALLGTAAAGDLGSVFGTTDPEWKDAPSSRFVTEALARAGHPAVLNVDVTLVAERPPRSAPHRDAMRATIAAPPRHPRRAGLGEGLERQRHDGLRARRRGLRLGRRPRGGPVIVAGFHPVRRGARRAARGGRGAPPPGRAARRAGRASWRRTARGEGDPRPASSRARSSTGRRGRPTTASPPAWRRASTTPWRRRSGGSRGTASSSSSTR